MAGKKEWDIHMEWWLLPVLAISIALCNILTNQTSKPAVATEPPQLDLLAEAPVKNDESKVVSNGEKPVPGVGFPYGGMMWMCAQIGSLPANNSGWDLYQNVLKEPVNNTWARPHLLIQQRPEGTIYTVTDDIVHPVYYDLWINDFACMEFQDDT